MPAILGRPASSARVQVGARRVWLGGMDEESKLPIGSRRAGIGRIFHGANLALAFLLELCALAALGYWGFLTGSGAVAKISLGVGTPLLAVILWGVFAAPRAPVSAPFVKPGAQVMVFGSAVVALYATGHSGLAVSFALLIIANSILVRL